MKARLAKTLLVASMGIFSVAASADNATPRDKPMPATTNNATQNGTPIGTTSSMGTTTPGTKYRRFSDETELRAYRDAHSACDGMTGTQQTSCRTDLTAKWSNVDPKCQKVSGSALDDCLKGNDHAQ